MDRVPLPGLTRLFGRRRGWLLLSQVGLILAILGLASTDPATNLEATAVMALLVAFMSASQDIVVDAYRIEILEEDKLGAGAAVVVLGYRIAMWVATAGALVIAGSGAIRRPIRPWPAWSWSAWSRCCSIPSPRARRPQHPEASGRRSPGSTRS